MSVLIIDYGMSNLGSIRRAVEECGADVVVSGDSRDLAEADHVILPGVGAFPEGMRNLRANGWPDPLRATVADGVPLLGICLGMQLLAEWGFEDEKTEGLGFIPGEVRLFAPQSDADKIPHVGWNDLYKTQDSVILKNIPDGTDFYFVHSYYFAARSAADVLAEVDFCGGFCAAVGRENVFGVQFHPEKSGRMGFQVLRDFLNFYKVAG